MHSPYFLLPTSYFLLPTSHFLQHNGHSPSGCTLEQRYVPSRPPSCGTLGPPGLCSTQEEIDWCGSIPDPGYKVQSLTRGPLSGVYGALSANEESRAVCVLRPVPCTLYPVPCTIRPVPCTIRPVSCSLYPVPCTLYPAPQAQHRSAAVPVVGSRPEPHKMPLASTSPGPSRASHNALSLS